MPWKVKVKWHHHVYYFNYYHINPDNNTPVKQRNVSPSQKIFQACPLDGAVVWEEGISRQLVCNEKFREK